ncbi:histidine kinase [Bernardetia sp. OM2101]|uniref:tetratricopeptide repeat-containing sensor histidine kinase n=1 Tax=Bernardetia sp. OM2101 TaxID=3344876 RepID=UPI0035D0B6E9
MKTILFYNRFLLLSVLYLLLSFSSFGQNEGAILEEIDKKILILTDSFIRKNPQKSLQIAEKMLVIANKNEYKEKEVIFLEKKVFICLLLAKNEEGISNAELAINLIKEHKLNHNLAKLYTHKGTALTRIGEVDAALLVLDSVIHYLDTAPKKKVNSIEYQIYYLKGRIYDREGKMEQAVDSYLKAMKIAKKMNSKRKLANILYDLGYVHNAQENWSKAIEFYEESLKLSTQVQDTMYMVFNHVFIAGSYMEQEKRTESKNNFLEKAHRHLQEALQLSQNQINNKPYELELIYFEFSNYYQGLKEYEKAIEYIYKSRKYTKQIKNKETLVANYTQAADCYFDNKKYQKAMQEIKQGISLAKEIKTFYHLIELYELAAKATEKQNKIKESYQYYKIYSTIKDSIFNEKRTNQVNELQTKYETEKKEQQIKELKQQKTIDELKSKTEISSLQAQRSILALVLLAPISLLIGGGWYVNRRRLYLKLEAEQKERAKQLSELKALRSQMNPHFIFNALNSIQDFIMLSEKENAQHYLGKFATLMRGFLDSSSKEKISLDKELPLIESYIELEGLRLGEEFSYDIIFDDKIDKGELDEIEIPPLLIQPYLENAFKHGLLHKMGEKKLLLEFDEIEKSNEKFLQLKITDNGIGRQKSAEINARKAQTHNSTHQSFATQATTERLELMKNQSTTNKNIEVEINDLKDNQGNGNGTEIVILIPINE